MHCLHPVRRYDDGSTGLIARYQSSDAGSSFYVCWLDTDAYAGGDLVIIEEYAIV